MEVSALASSVIRTVCPHDCPDQCSLLATVAGERLVRVAGDPDHPFTRGFLCGKVNRYPERVHAADRLLAPLQRQGPKGAGALVPISWDQALDQIAARWQDIRARYGNTALCGWAYSGHMGLVNRNLYQALFHALGATRADTGTVCDATAEAGWAYTYGPVPGTDPEDVAGSDLVVAWGANLATTNVHLLPFVAAARRRGARLVVIDPYRSRTARQADWHIPVRIGTDAALALGVMHVLVRDGLTDPGFIARETVGFERLAAAVLPHYPPDRVQAVTGVPAAGVERLAHAYGRARAPFLRLGQAMSRHAGGGMAIRTVACLPALVGAWDRPGGGALMETAGAFGLNYDALRRPDLLPHPVRSLNLVQLGAALLDYRDPPLMGLFVAAHNPAVTCPEPARVVAGLAREDLFTVVHDTFLTDTARYADIVLPACTALETEDLYRSYGSFYLQYGPRVLVPAGESRPNSWVAAELARRLGLADPVFSRATDEHIRALFQGATGPAAALDPGALPGAGPVKLPVPGGPRKWQTPSGKVEFYSAAMAAAGLPPLPEWRPDPGEAAAAGRWPLRLLTAPGHHISHTTFSWAPGLVRQEGAPRVLLHPDDAGARGIRDGDPVELYNDRGRVGLYARVTPDAPPGVAVVEGQRDRRHYLSGGPVNVLTSDQVADMAGGATYQSTWLDVRPLQRPGPR